MFDTIIGTMFFIMPIVFIIGGFYLFKTEFWKLSEMSWSLATSSIWMIIYQIAMSAAVLGVSYHYNAMTIFWGLIFSTILLYSFYYMAHRVVYYNTYTKPAQEMVQDIMKFSKKKHMEITRNL